MTELEKLEHYLKEHGYRYERVDNPIPESMIPVRQKYNLPEGWCEQHQIVVYDAKGRRAWDAICHWGSYGYSQGLLEIMGSLVPKTGRDRVIGWLTAQDVIDKLEEKAWREASSP